MFKWFNNSDSLSDNSVDAFIDNLSYWQQINLHITLLQSQRNLDYMSARAKALAEYENLDNLKYCMQEALNSPIPKTPKKSYNKLPSI